MPPLNSLSPLLNLPIIQTSPRSLESKNILLLIQVHNLRVILSFVLCFIPHTHSINKSFHSSSLAHLLSIPFSHLLQLQPRLRLDHLSPKQLQLICLAWLHMYNLHQITCHLGGEGRERERIWNSRFLKKECQKLFLKLEKNKINNAIASSLVSLLWVPCLPYPSFTQLPK